MSPMPETRRQMITRGGIVPGGMLAEAMKITHILTAAVDYRLLESIVFPLYGIFLAFLAVIAVIGTVAGGAVLAGGFSPWQRPARPAAGRAARESGPARIRAREARLAPALLPGLRGSGDVQRRMPQGSFLDHA